MRQLSKILNKSGKECFAQLWYEFVIRYVAVHGSAGGMVIATRDT